MIRVLIWSLAFLVIYSAQADTLYYKRGRIRKNITITRAGYQTILYTENNSSPLKVPAELIRHMEYSDAPYEFSSGYTSLQQKNYEDALYFLQQALNPVVETRKWLPIHTHYYLGLTYQKLAETGTLSNERYQKAREHYQKSIELNSDNFFARECLLNSAQCSIRMKETDKGRETLAQLEKIADDATWKFRISLWRGHGYLENGDHQKAIREYRQAQSNAKESFHSESAALAIAECRLSQKEYSKAENQYRELIKSKNAIVRAKTQNGLASCFFQQNKYQAARRIALKVILEQAEATSEQAQAYYLLTACYYHLRKYEQGSLERARTYHRFLLLGYPDSEWAKKAATLLQEIK